MLFSVVIPVFNRVLELERALNSVASQTYKPEEVIIINDGSELQYTKKIKCLIKNYAEINVRLISYPNNVNGAYARNVGIDNAKAEFICFLDSDDEWEIDKLDKIRLLNANNPQCKFFYNQYRNIIAGKAQEPLPVKGICKDQSVAEYTFISNQGKSGIQSSCICIKSNFAKLIRFNDSLIGHQDWDFAIRALSNCDDVLFIEEALTLRYVDGSEEGKVSTSLAYDFSYSFIKKLENYFSIKAMAAYAVNILLPKKFMSYKPLICMDKYELLAFIFYPFEFMSEFRALYLFRKRYSRILRLCKKNNFNKVILVGWNSYSRYIEQQMVKSGIEVVCVIDKYKRISSHNSVNVLGYDVLNTDLVKGVKCVIAVTDLYHESMAADVRSYQPKTRLEYF